MRRKPGNRARDDRNLPRPLGLFLARRFGGRIWTGSARVRSCTARLRCRWHGLQEAGVEVKVDQTRVICRRQPPALRSRGGDELGIELGGDAQLFATAAAQGVSRAPNRRARSQAAEPSSYPGPATAGRHSPASRQRSKRCSPAAGHSTDPAGLAPAATQQLEQGAAA